MVYIGPRRVYDGVKLMHLEDLMAQASGRVQRFWLSAMAIAALAGTAFAGELTVVGSAKYEGDLGLRIALDGQPTYAESNAPDVETQFRARVYARLDGVALSEGAQLDLLVGYDGAGLAQFRLSVRRESGVNRLVLASRLDGGGFAETPAGTGMAAAPGWHGLEIDWRIGAGDGAMDLLVDGAAAPSLAALDNDQSRIDLIRLGAVDGTASGFLELDAFEAARLDPIGEICFTAAQFGQALAAWPTAHSIRYLLTQQARACPL